MSNPNILDPNDESWLEMPLNIPPLQAIDPDAEIVDIEDDSPDKASRPQRESEEDKPAQQEEKVEEVFEDSFGEVPDILLPSIQRPLRGKLRVARAETTDEEGDKEVEMAPRDILADLEQRKKKRKEEEKAKAAAKSRPSTGDPVTKTS
ncbi:hypothetical protein RHGRI_016932 [Rhododendron griersonianum]|uniref:Uncharacterized protein n=1 Tax=Rhododendron griersonianum TaxID=479676 RepID=A0AAV6JW09_9ERIC|nr:hypothetical protein RHGRI_016932 [Rhododendron griersonianum]